MKAVLFIVKYTMIGMLVLLTCLFIQKKTSAVAASFNPSYLISNTDFVDTGGMNTAEIQQFLNNRGSCLSNYSQDGRSAAQIIYDAAHGHGDASGSMNGITINSSTGTVNPEVLLVTLQKEQSLISDHSRCTDNVLRKAMGYGCPDSGDCNPKYNGFTKQVEWGAWQLRYNYERASGHGFSDYQVGQSFCFDDCNGQHCGRFDNRATAALYRYTPHVYNGNYNFWNLYHNTYQFQRPSYSYSYVTQSAYPTLRKGGSYKFILKIKNTGSQTWTQNVLHLGTSHSQDRVSGFLREGGTPTGWLSSNRIKMKEASVVPNATATFEFYMKVPNNMPSGSYNEYFQPIAEHITWMEDKGIFWRVTVPQSPPQYSYSYVGQNAHPTLSKNGSYKFILKVKNTGSVTWQKQWLHLGTDRGQDRVSGFYRAGGDPSGWVSNNRIVMKENTVAPNQTATFEFYMKVPPYFVSGSYKEYFRVVADSRAWMQDYGIYWNIKVR